MSPTHRETILYGDQAQILSREEDHTHYRLPSPDDEVLLTAYPVFPGIEIIYNDGSRETVCGEEPKYKLMGYEAKDFYRYITEPEASAAEYAQCCALAYAVSDYMEQLRRDAGIRFPSDR